MTNKWSDVYGKADSFWRKTDPESRAVSGYANELYSDIVAEIGHDEAHAVVASQTCLVLACSIAALAMFTGDKSWTVGAVVLTLVGERLAANAEVIAFPGGSKRDGRGRS